MKSKSTLIIVFLLAFANSLAMANDEVNWPKIYKDELFHITEVMVTDVASPPVAARIYAYSNLASYLVMKNQGAAFRYPALDQNSLIGEISANANISLSSPEFSAIYALMTVGQGLMPSGYLLEEKKEAWIDFAIKSKIIKKKEVENHLAFANEIAQKVLAQAKADGYLQLPALTRYTPKEGPGNWYPTPPAYISAIEPEWRTIKTFFIPELNAYSGNPMAPYDLTPGSSFHTQMLEVYETGKNLTDEQRLIANFWDCNPFMVKFSGHMAIGVKKISPGGHWMGITGIVAEKAQISFAETAYIHAMVAMGLHDAFISCWETKYKTDRIRPETVINRELDQRWRPQLQTPPFPEYTSGHSVISRASAVILTGYFGDDFAFVDNSEVYFGLPEREFTSFLQASEEAAISRLYGGIHFRDAIEEGITQGEKIGKMIWKKVTKSELLITKK